jgi:UDP-glucose 4-epimerase
MRVAVTGGQGLIGAHLLAQLTAAAIDVTLIGEDAARSPYVSALVAAGRARLTRCDERFRDEPTLRSGLADADALVLLAHIPPATSSSGESPSNELESNVASTMRILRAALGRARHVVFASSDSVYGTPARTPVRETDPAHPRTPFGAAKLACEQVVRVACAAAGARATILRYSVVYGPGENGTGTIPTFVRAALAGQQLRFDGEGVDEHDYLHVADAVGATMSALRREADGIYNIGSGVGTTTLELAQLVMWISGGRSPLIRGASLGRDTDRTSVVLDTERARSELDFAPRRPLAEGLAEEIGWFRTIARPELVPSLVAASA